MISPTPRPLPDNTQHSQETDIHAPGGIRIHNPSKRAAADPRLRPRGHWDRPHSLDLAKTIVIDAAILWYKGATHFFLIHRRLVWRSDSEGNKRYKISDARHISKVTKTGCRYFGCASICLMYQQLKLHINVKNIVATWKMFPVYNSINLYEVITPASEVGFYRKLQEWLLLSTQICNSDL